MLGIMEDYEHFDLDLIIHINSIIGILTQLGVGPETGFAISDKTTTWDDWSNLPTDIESVKTYIFLRVRLLFDPPTNSAVTNSYEKIIQELEWRVVTAMDLSKMKEGG